MKEKDIFIPKTYSSSIDKAKVDAALHVLKSYGIKRVESKKFGEKEYKFN